MKYRYRLAGSTHFVPEGRVVVAPPPPVALLRSPRLQLDLRGSQWLAPNLAMADVRGEVDSHRMRGHFCEAVCTIVSRISVALVGQGAPRGPLGHGGEP